MIGEDGFARKCSRCGYFRYQTLDFDLEAALGREIAFTGKDPTVRWDAEPASLADPTSGG